MLDGREDALVDYIPLVYLEESLSELMRGQEEVLGDCLRGL